MSAKTAIEQVKQLGLEPFDPRLTLEAFHKRLSGKRGRLKTTLTDQKFIAGIGIKIPAPESRSTPGASISMALPTIAL